MRLFSVLITVILFSASSLDAQDWSTRVVATGTKPSLAIDSDGDPHIGYIYEVATGWVRYAAWNPSTEQFDTLTAASGNFYGPPSLALDQDGLPGMNFHRHSPTPEQMYAHYDGATWSIEAIVSDNHDGWDNSLVYDSNNLPRTSSVDPSNFGGAATGVEYAVFNGTSWSVEAIGSAIINYFSGTSLELDASDNPHIVYYDDITDDLMYAANTGGGWTFSTVESAGDVGRFPSLELDGSENPHISYYQHIVDSIGVVKYASWNGSSWDISTVDTLDRVYLDLARVLTSLDLDDGDVPHISYNDEAVVKYATMSGSSWTIETVVDVHDGSAIMGQANSIGVASDGTVHIAYYELLTRSPLTGIVMHARRDPAGSVIPCEEIDFFNAKCNANGAAQAMVRLLNSTQYAGETVEFQLDQTVYPVVLITNGTHTIGRLQVPQAGFGQHTVTLLTPGGCYDPVTFICQVDRADVDPSFDLLWAEFDALEGGESGLPVETALLGNYPNPFNPSTTITYSVGAETRVTLRVYNSLGEEIVTLVDEVQGPGEKSVQWDGRNSAGTQAATGIYLYRLTAHDRILTGKMMFVK